MGKKSQRQRSGRKTKTQVQGPHNFVPETGIGCYIVHFDAPWLLVLGVEPFDTDDYEDDVTFPDIAISAEAPHTLSIINASDHTRTFYVTMFHDVFDGQKFAKGTTTDEEGVTRECITFVVVARACTMLHLGMLGEDEDLQEVHAQGIEGSFTHFFAESCYAVDFRCPVGTPILAIGSGKVAEVRQSHTVTGIHINNLFMWNSVMLELDDGAFVEYVHIK
eukprot:gene3734-4674_t